MVEDLDAPEVQSAVAEKPEPIQIPTDGEVLLYFSAEWCGPCKNFGPLVARVCEAGELPVIKIVVDEHPDFVYAQQVRSVPVIKLFRDGNVVGTAIGAMGESQLREWLNTQLDQ